MNVYIVIRNDGVITEVFDNEDGAYNFCERINSTCHVSYQFYCEEHEVMSGDGISESIDIRKM